MGAWIDRISLGEKFTLDKAYADIFYSTGIPFRFADSPALETFIKLAQPAYAPPTAKAIAGPLLNHAHQGMMAKMNQFVQDQTRISLVSDGWTSLRNDYMVNFVAVFPNKSVKLNIAHDLENAMMAIEIDKISGVVTDNAACMRAAWKILEAKYPGLICNGCAAHALNILVKDVCKLEPYATILESSRHATSFVKDRNALTKRFERIQQHMHVDGELSGTLSTTA
ncbi:hypothetical protein DYB35_011184 [Aphanomyces astaci]|uniref:DUF659 domain-containing protein n=1 Tax=Aphanomyces astaci TaxID=112090 RepID=A0A3R7AMM8_APHAT|nr:hypothetical protein DYB35_011184 [Aphanomyces astaci]